jgi:hypothetical protein
VTADLDAIAAVGLGAIERLVGLAQQGVGVSWTTPSSEVSGTRITNSSPPKRPMRS